MRDGFRCRNQTTHSNESGKDPRSRQLSARPLRGHAGGAGQHLDIQAQSGTENPSDGGACRTLSSPVCFDGESVGGGVDMRQ